MMRLAFKVVVLVAIVVGLTPAPAQGTCLAGTSCNPLSCYQKCVKLGALGGTCGSITQQCVCTYPHPQP